ncbi:WXG100 family type VII secretion target [Pseudonocardia sp. NPDC049635]|uniref:WXG100 family type VII secretion target n=1 Tax=Pseudonocardia sp. NPDC049635 TaxID=3155506 RepID=UPI0033F6CC82
MAQGFGTTTEEMALAAGQVREVSEAVNGELGGLRSRLEATRGQWTGAAATAFTALMAEWDTEAKRLNVALADIAEQLGGTAAAYQQVEDENARNVSAITSVLG